MKPKIKISFRLLSLFLLVSICLCACSFAVDMGEDVLTYEEESIATSEVRYWFATLKTRYLISQNAQGNDTEIFWNSKTASGISHAEQFYGIAKNYLSELLVCKHLFSAWELTYLNDGKSQAKSQIENVKKYYQDDLDEWNALLADLGVDETQLCSIYLTNYQKDAVKRQILADLTASSTQYAAALQDYFLHSYLRVHVAVIYLNRDPQNSTTELSENEIAQKDARANELLQKGIQGEDPKTLIDTYTEYKAPSSQNGIFLAPQDASVYPAEVYSAMTTMQIGTWQRVNVEKDGVQYAYVFYRCPLGDYNLMNDNEKSLLTSRTQERYYQTMIAQWYARVSCNQTLWDSFSVITIPASKNTNL